MIEKFQKLNTGRRNVSETGMKERMKELRKQISKVKERKKKE